MITFKQLWDNHPTVKEEDNPCDSSLNNQCAIKLGTALHRCGVNITGVPQCWFGHKGQGHYLLAEELAKGLSRTNIPGIHLAKKYPGASFRANILGQTGIIFFKDYWRRTYNGVTESFRNRSGDHIDLWNGSRLTAWTSWFRISWGITIEGRWSDFYDSRSVWFWKVP